MVMKMEYMCEDVSGVELGRLGELISSFMEQGWQPLDEAESLVVPRMFGSDGIEGCQLWMKRACSERHAVAA